MGGKSWNIGGTASSPIRSTCVASGSNSPSLKQLTENPYSFNLIKWERTQYSIYNHGNLYFGTPAYALWGLNGLPASWTSNDELSLLSKLADEIRGHSFNAAIFAAEGKQSLETVVNTTRAVFGIVKAVKSRDYQAVLRSLARVTGQSPPKQLKRSLKTKDLSGAWLSIQYGWKPLLNDIFEAMKYVESLTASPRSLIYRATKTVNSTWDDRSSSSFNHLFATGTRTVKYKVVLREKISQTRSLGLLNPASVVWEKVPFSFVVDWFIPIGPYLDNVSLFSGLDLSYVRSEFARATTKGDQCLPSDPSIFWIVTGGSWKSTTIYFRRTVGTSLNVPRPELKALDKAFSLGHLKNAAALIHQLTAPSKHG